MPFSEAERKRFAQVVKIGKVQICKFCNHTPLSLKKIGDNQYLCNQCGRISPKIMVEDLLQKGVNA